jgi:hypothetical protein
MNVSSGSWIAVGWVTYSLFPAIDKRRGDVR